MEKTIKKATRVVIYIKDIEIIMGKKSGAAWNLYHKIKKFYHKERHQVLTAEEFCQFLGIKEETIQDRLRV
jgi:hypothetical protein